MVAPTPGTLVSTPGLPSQASSLLSRAKTALSRALRSASRAALTVVTLSRARPAGRGRALEAVGLHRGHLDDLAAAGDPGVQLDGLGRDDGLRFGPDDAGEPGQVGRVQAVVLGRGAGRLGRGPDAGGVDDGDREAGGGQRGGDAALVPAGGLDDDQGGAGGEPAGGEVGQAVVAVGEREPVGPAGAVAAGRVVLGLVHGVPVLADPGSRRRAGGAAHVTVRARATGGRRPALRRGVGRWAVPGYDRGRRPPDRPGPTRPGSVKVTREPHLMPDAPVEPPIACDAEPIRVPAAVQPPGVLLAVSAADLTIAQASDNAAAALGADRPVIGTRLTDWLPASPWVDRLGPDAVDATPLYLATVRPAGAAGFFHLIVHRHDGVLIAELQPTAGPAPVPFQDLYRSVRTGIEALEAAGTPQDLWHAAATQVRRLTGFDRVMVYRFDPQWNGQVVAESLADGVDPWLGLRYPASDIPAQARDLYLASRVRLVADTAYAPVPIHPAVNPDTGRPLDLTHALFRSVSPIHLEYLRNMGVGASMSVSIVRDGRLWGMVLCHHRTAVRASFAVHTAAGLLGQVLALQLSAKERAGDAEATVGLGAGVAELLRSMSDAGDVAAGLSAAAARTLALAAAAGAAVTGPDHAPVLIGQTPDAAEVVALVDWLAESVADDVYRTDHLSAAHAPAAAYVGQASGLLAAVVSRADRAYVLWFRPEVVRDRYWAGDPTKPHEVIAGGRTFRPRTDFAAWKQTLRDRSHPWEPHRVEAADQLRQAAVGIVLRQAQERARLTTELQRTNRELEAFSYSVSHDLRAPFRHIVGYADLLTRRAGNSVDETAQRYVKTIRDSARFAGTLVDSLLALSQVGRSALRVVAVDLNQLVAEVRRETAEQEGVGRDIDWSVAPLPVVAGDVVMLRVALRNLLSNAVKYTRPRPRATITIGTTVTAPPDAFPAGERPDPDHALLFVRDDGVGFDVRYRDKLFGVFQRLHRPEEFEGTGIGLANVRRIVERHGGRIGVTSAVGAGTTFFLTLPRAGPP